MRAVLAQVLNLLYSGVCISTGGLGSGVGLLLVSVFQTQVLPVQVR